MIKTKNLVPDIYYNKSRDFQAIGRVFEVLYNYAKTNTDLIRNSYEDIKMLDLFAKTVGFNSKHNYNTEDLLTLCNTFIKILQNKGSIKSIEMSITALLKAQHIESTKFFIEDVVETVDDSKVKRFYINIYIPIELTDLILLEDLFDYILPAGYTYRFISAKFSGKPYITQVGGQTLINSYDITSNSMSQVALLRQITGSPTQNITRPHIDVSDPESVSYTQPEQLGISYANVVYRPKEIGE